MFHNSYKKIPITPLHQLTPEQMVTVSLRHSQKQTLAPGTQPFRLGLVQQHRRMLDVPQHLLEYLETERLGRSAKKRVFHKQERGTKIDRHAKLFPARIRYEINVARRIELHALAIDCHPQTALQQLHLYMAQSCHRVLLKQPLPFQLQHGHALTENSHFKPSRCRRIRSQPPFQEVIYTYHSDVYSLISAIKLTHNKSRQKPFFTY